jgi:hypothetical protein
MRRFPAPPVCRRAQDRAQGRLLRTPGDLRPNPIDAGASRVPLRRTSLQIAAPGHAVTPRFVGIIEAVRGTGRRFTGYAASRGAPVDRHCR